jgi:Kef-type K+ transport system membrane component KefB
MPPRGAGKTLIDKDRLAGRASPGRRLPGTVSFGVLVVIVLAGLAGPLLGLKGGFFVPVIVGEILAGVVVGKTGLRIVDPANPTVSFLAEVGFAMLMLTVGMNVPLRDPRLASSLRTGALFALVVAALSPLAGLLSAAVAGTGHAAVYAVVLASGSAAVLLPAIQEARLVGADALATMAEVTIADVATIVLVPVVLQPSRVGHALLGAVLVTAAVLALFATSRVLAPRPWVRHVRELSKRRHWVLDLRLSLLVLFFLAWLAQESGTSILIAGFGAGLVVAAIGGPHRLSTQVRGVAGGFFVPLYFVVLGAQLDLRGLVNNPAMIALAGALLGSNLVLHVLGARATRRSLGAGLAASAQIGVPAAVATVGLAEHVISRPVATAIILAALASLGAATFGVQLLVRDEQRGRDAARRAARLTATGEPAHP